MGALHDCPDHWQRRLICRRWVLCYVWTSIDLDSSGRYAGLQLSRALQHISQVAWAALGKPGLGGFSQIVWQLTGCELGAVSMATGCIC